MKTLVITLLIVVFHSSALAQEGFVVKIFPDKLTFPINCETQADMQAKELSILYICKNSNNKKYFFNFRLNNIDMTVNPNVSEIKESQFKSYIVYERTSKDPDNGNQRDDVTFCTKEVCLDLVGDYEQSIKESITAQLRE